MTDFERLYSRFDEVLRPYGKPIDIWPVRPGYFVAISDGRHGSAIVSLDGGMIDEARRNLPEG
jgi:hypothetical protein